MPSHPAVRIGIDESVAAVAAAAALAAISVQVGWFWRAEAGSVAAIGACAGLGLLALASPSASFGDIARVAGFATVVLAFPSSVLVLARSEEPDRFERVAGVDAAATSVAVSEHAFRRADVAVLVPAAQPRHALVAASLAARRNGPLLVTPPGGVRDDVRAELDRLEVSRVVIVADRRIAIVERLLTRDGIETEWLAGTAAEVAATIGVVGTSSSALVTDAIDGSGHVRPSVADAITRGVPIFLADPDSVPLVTAGALDESRPTDIVVAAAGGGEIRRILASAIEGARMSWAFGADPVERDGRWVAAASSPVDVGIAAAAATHTGGRVVLVQGERSSILGGGGRTVIVGGTASVPDPA